MNTLNIIGWTLLCIGWLMYTIHFRTPKGRLIAQLIVFGSATILFIIDLIIRIKC